MLFRILIIAGLVYIGLKLWRRYLAPNSPRQNYVEQKKDAVEKLIKDPICGLYISEKNALKADNHFFCSMECLNTFKQRSY